MGKGSAWLVVWFASGLRLLRWHVRVETRHVHAERLLAKAGVASVKGRGISHPWNGAVAGVERAQRSGGLHKRSAEDWGDPLTRAIGAEPLSEVCLRIARASARKIYWGERCGKAKRRRSTSRRVAVLRSPSLLSIPRGGSRPLSFGVRAIGITG